MASRKKEKERKEKKRKGKERKEKGKGSVVLVFCCAPSGGLGGTIYKKTHDHLYPECFFPYSMFIPSLSW
eukprot:COSAG06_NODE_3580_length_5157_cov_3.025104_6_plen_70_part_00